MDRVEVSDEAAGHTFGAIHPFSASPTLGSAKGTQSKAARIELLLVEDDASVRTSLAENLVEEGYAVATADNGEAALNLLRLGAAPSVILLDLMMPGMDGWTFRVEQKKDARLANIPVIVLSADSTAPARAVDASAFISKPFDIETVLATIERVLSELDAERVEHTERLRSLGTLTAGVAHEIGNPLTYVIANLQMLASRLPGVLPPESSDLLGLLGDAVEGADRIGSIVRSIQTIAHATTREPAKIVDLRGVAEAAIKIVEHELRHRAEVVLRLGPTLPVLASKGRLEQVVMNLLMNAAHAVGDSPDSERVITVATFNTSTKRVRLEVADTGPGIPPRLVERIFEPFFTTKAVGVGTGLGLSISRAIVEAAGGAIGVDPAPGRGAKFWFELPCATARPAIEPAGPPPLDVGQLRVLVVDDDPRILAVVRRYLEPQHEVLISTDTAHALDLVRRCHPDVVLCDLMMPTASGAAFVEHLRANAPAIVPRVAFMTGGAFTADDRAVAECGDHPVLVKPFSSDELKAVIVETATRSAADSNSGGST